MDTKGLPEAPKRFAENMAIRFTPEYFVLGINSGSEGTAFALTPAHAKRLQQYLAHRIEEYEKENGEIAAEWDPNVKSPVQRANPPTEGS